MKLNSKEGFNEIVDIHKLKKEEIQLNQPLDWHIYDGKGRLLIKAGMQLRSARQIDKLIQLDAFRHKDVDDNNSSIDVVVNNTLSPFDRIEKLLDYLEGLFSVIVHEPANPNKLIPQKLLKLSHSIVNLCEYDIDATIGTIHIEHTHGYTTKHPLHCAILCYVLAKKEGISGARLHSVICAAITSNLGMLDMQCGELMSHRGPLTSEQRDEVNKHTMRSAVLLKRIGVVDKLWVEIVLQHHEKNDGTGYPRGLKGKEFIIEAKVLGLVDRYTAMVAPREYRESMTPTEALKLMFRERGPEVDEFLGTVLIKEMGVFPPGAAVELANKEIAIVTRRGEDGMAPIVKSVLTSNGRFYNEPIMRDSTSKKYKILGLHEMPYGFEYDLEKLWDYDLG